MVETGSSSSGRNRENTSTQYSTSVIPSFPQEISVEILSKLPVKSLLQLRCVSKSWLALISSPEFVKAHLHSLANDREYNRHRVILNWGTNLRACSLSSLLNNPISESSEMVCPMRGFHIEWCGSVNGLICLAGTEKINKSKNNKSFWLTGARITVCVWNPSIRMGRKLPVISSHVRYTSFRYGFGYDELHDEYKIVVIISDFNDTKVEVYSLKTDWFWRTVGDFQEGSQINYSATCVKGKLYWISLSDDENNYFPSRNIVSFDLSNETWDQVEQPNYGEGEFHMMLGALGSDLVVLCNYERIYSDVWVMNDHGVEASWKKMFTIRCPDDPRNDKPFTCSYMSFSPLFCQSYKGEVLVLYRSVFMIYKPKDASIRQAEVAELREWFEAEIFVESLVNPFVDS